MEQGGKVVTLAFEAEPNNVKRPIDKKIRIKKIKKVVTLPNQAYTSQPSRAKVASRASNFFQSGTTANQHGRDKLAEDVIQSPKDEDQQPNDQATNRLSA